MSEITERKLVNYGVFDDNGNMIQKGTVFENVLPHIPNASIIPSDADFNSHYKDYDGRVVKLSANQVLVKKQLKSGFVYKPREDLVEDKRDLQFVKKLKWSEIKRIRENKSTEDFEYNGVVYDADAVSQDKIAKAALASRETQEWTAADNSIQSFTRETFKAFADAVAERNEANHAKSRALRTMINQAESVEAIEAIKWTSI